MTNFGHIGRYQIIQPLGQGGMAAVYLAHDPGLQRDVALKLTSPDLLADQTFRERFAREARTIATLEHYAIVPVYEFGEDRGQLFLTMRLMSGGSLAERIERGPLSPATIQSILERIGSALDKAHAQGIVHRDLKPANILFDEDDRAYLSDFGIVKVASATRLTMTGGLIGTPAYMSPEQITGQGEIDGRADIYALGTVLFEMLTGRQPYEADTAMALALKHATEPVPRLRDVAPHLAVYQPVIDRAMAKDPAQRFRHGSDLAAAFRQAAAGQPVTGANLYGQTVIDKPRPAGAPVPGSRPARERSGPSRSLIAALLVLFAVTAGGYLAFGFLRGGNGDLEPTADPNQMGMAELDPGAPAVVSDEAETPTATATFALPDTGAAAATSTLSGAVPAVADEPEPTATQPAALPPTAALSPTPPPPAAGSEIIFHSNRDGDYEIYAVAPDGSGLRQLTNNDAADQYPRVSPDGRQIAFQSERDDNIEVYVMDRDGGNQLRLTADPGQDRLPNWSPDGRRVVFSSNRLDPSSGAVMDIFIVNATGGGLVQVTDEPAYESHPSWSVDGRLAFNVTDRGTNYWQLYSANPDGSDRRRITQSAVDEWSPEWSPDGRQILFLSERDDPADAAIYVMNADGSSARRLYNYPGEEWGATWSADGRHIIFAADQPDGTADLFIMNADGSNARRFMERGGYPAWAAPIEEEVGAAQPVSLASIANASLDFVSPPSGDVELGGVPFFVGDEIFKSQASVSAFTEAPTSAYVAVGVNHAQRLHVLLTSGNGFKRFEGAVIGEVAAYCDGTRFTVSELHLGREVREWHAAENVVSTASRAQQVWTGEIWSAAGEMGQIDLLTLELPRACRDSDLTGVELVDTSVETVASLDPALNLIALTVE